GAEVGSKLPRQPSTTSAPRLSRQLSLPSPPRAKARPRARLLKPTPQPGRWLDMDCNVLLNMQRIGESRWRPLEATPPIEPPTPLTIRDKGFSGLISARICTRIEASECGRAEPHAELVGHVAGLPVSVGASSSGEQAQAQRKDKAFRVKMTTQLSPGTPQSQMSLTWWFNGRGSLELCYWPEQGALPAKGKEYPGLGYKRLRDKPPKAQEQQQQPAEAQ
ncbi:hypothetical protein QJQ45_022569, partial [Haematococcus lacustris]